MSNQPIPLTATEGLHGSWVRLKNGRCGRVSTESDTTVGVQLHGMLLPAEVPRDEVALVPSVVTLAEPKDVASQAAAKALAGDPDGFQHLMAICWTACGSLYYPVAEYFGKPGNKNYDGAKKATTAAFIEDFLDDELGPYREMIPVEQQTAVNLGVFRHIGSRCKNRLIDEIRHAGTRGGKQARFEASIMGAGGPRHSIDRLMKSGKPFSSILAAAPSNVVQQDALLAHLAEDRDALIAEGGELWYNALVLLASLYPKIERGDAVRAVAQALGVSERQARNVMPRLIRRAWANLERYRSATRRLYLLLVEPSLPDWNNVGRGRVRARGVSWSAKKSAEW